LVTGPGLASRRQRRIVTVAVLAMILLAVLLIVLDWNEVKQIIHKADFRFTLVALAFTLVSYVCLSYSYAVVNRGFGIKIRWKSLLAVGFVSSTLNNILAFMGAAGHSLRLVLMKKEDTGTGEILAASLFHSYINNVMMFFLLPISLLWLVLGRLVSGGAAVSLAFTAGLFIFFLGISAAILFVSRLRAVVLLIIHRLWHFFTRHDIGSLLGDFDTAMKKGVVALRGRQFALAFLLMVGDWTCAVVTLWFCFAALGGTPAWGILLSGFGFGISAGNVSMVPGGLGVQEASMAGVFAALGTSFAQAVLAAILFRVVYDFVPFFVSLAFYRRLIRGHEAGENRPEGGGNGGETDY